MDGEPTGGLNPKIHFGFGRMRYCVSTKLDILAERMLVFSSSLERSTWHLLLIEDEFECITKSVIFIQNLKGCCLVAGTRKL